MKVGRQGQAKLVEGENGRRRGKRGRISGGGWGEGNIGRRIREGVRQTTVCVAADEVDGQDE